MAATIGNGNITFGDGSTMSTNPIPAGTVKYFYQAAAPVSWTRLADDPTNNRMLRVVSSGNGGVVSGSASPVSNSVVPSHTHGFSTGNVSADHSHSGNTGWVSADHSHATYLWAANGGNGYYSGHFGVPQYSGQTGGISANHYHGFSTGGISANHSHSGTTDNGSSQTNWAPRYVDMIACSRAYS